ncbi:MAG: gfo/Idh/MocA family oxidoreductase [Acidobacteria bacterium]|nr:MAG: gfo/Idh/MocA family oxidoreductase [Acidobacteriota bacterium]
MKKGTKPSRKIRYAVVGLGHIAQVAVLPAFRTARNAELVALISDDAEKRKKLGRKYKVDRPASYDEYDECLSDGVDAVYITLPNHLHREYAVRAAEAGVHVLCEKPLAVTSEECQAMIDAAESNGVKVMAAYRLHFEKANLEAIRLVESGKLGGTRFFSSEFAQNVDPENVRLMPVAQGGGPVYDMGVYCINAARHLFQSEPIGISALSESNGEPRFKQSEEMTSVLMRFPGDRLATFTCSFGAADIGHYTLVGTKGTLVADPAYEYAEGLSYRITINEKTKVRKFPKRDQFAAEITYFSDCILQNKEPEPNGYEGLADVRVIEAIYESARTGSVVSLPPFSKQPRPTPAQEIHKPAHGKPETVKAKSPSGEAA